MKHSKKLQIVSRAVKQWRAGKRYPHERMPEALWAQVEDLLLRHEIAEVSRATGINEERLIRRSPRRRQVGKRLARHPKSGGFVELPTGSMPMPSMAAPVELEMRRSDGAVWSARLRDGAAVDWKALAQGFLSGGHVAPGVET